MKEPKIYVGTCNVVQPDQYDVLVFVPDTFSGTTDHLVAEAKFKYLELSERKQFESTRPVPIKQAAGIKVLGDESIRQKRKRIIR